ncbi:hypothetical protein QE152_g16930 [Popillia japonica]|uniref:Uncharacterized protein n=1 Tax=Popillia japonica TaxID=7064 RepID=A0AAW1L682_POPJA
MVWVNERSVRCVLYLLTRDPKSIRLAVCERLDEVKLDYQGKNLICPFELRFCYITMMGHAQLHKPKTNCTKLFDKRREYLPFSRDLSPSDYHMFGPVKEELGGHHFDDDEGVPLIACTF